MDSVVHTGSTKAVSGTALVSLSFSSPEDEQVCLLLQLPVDAHDAKMLEDECAAIVHQSLLSNEGDAWHRLDGTLKELNGLFKGLLLSKTIEEIHAVVALLDAEGTLHVSHAGRGEAYLVRGELASQITEFSKGKPLSAFVHISSGPLEPNDVVLFSTQRLLRTCTPAQLAELSRHEESVLEDIADVLEGEQEVAALAALRIPSGEGAAPAREMKRDQRTRPALADRARRRRQSAGWTLPFLPAITLPSLERVMERLSSITRSVAKIGAGAGKKGASLGKKSVPKLASASSDVAALLQTVREKTANFLADLKHPQRKRRAHLLLLAGAVAAFLIIWLIVSLTTSSQRSKTRGELQQLLQQVSDDLQTADNRKLAGDTAAASTILDRADAEAKQVLENQSGLFRSEALDLIDRIKQKREELTNTVRVSPRIVVNLSEKDPHITAQGLIGLSDGEFVAYDRQNTYRILLNKVDDPKRIAENELILNGTSFPWSKSEVFLTTGNSVIESNDSQITTMKTDDPAGWVTGKAAQTYLRYLYILSTDKKQIYKYERLTNRYGAPVQYNVNGDLKGAIDMVIDGSVYVLKEGGSVLKLLRGETQPFAINHAPDGLLKNVTKIFKLPNGDFYFLDPVQNRIVVTTDGGQTGQSDYVRQYILEGAQLGTLQDLYVGPDENHLYVIDDKRVYVVDLGTK
jgi:hypothetical protein